MLVSGFKIQKKPFQKELIKTSACKVENCILMFIGLKLKGVGKLLGMSYQESLELSAVRREANKNVLIHYLFKDRQNQRVGTGREE